MEALGGPDMAWMGGRVDSVSARRGQGLEAGRDEEGYGPGASAAPHSVTLKNATPDGRLPDSDPDKDLKPGAGNSAAPRRVRTAAWPLLECGGDVHAASQWVLQTALGQLAVHLNDRERQSLFHPRCLICSEALD